MSRRKIRTVNGIHEKSVLKCAMDSMGGMWVAERSRFARAEFKLAGTTGAGHIRRYDAF